MSFFEDASLVLIPSAYKDQKVYSVKPTDGTGDLTFSRASSATRVASNGLIEKVRTNLALQSEAFNTTWLVNAAPTITANTTIAPDGTTTGDTIAATAASSGVYQVPTVANGVEHSFSVYIKNITSATSILIGCDLGPINGNVTFNSVTGAITSVGAGITGSSVTNAGNGWYRVSGTYVSTGTSNTFVIFGTSAMTFAAWGAQFETGVTTDYIATTTAAVSVGPVSGLPRLDYLGSTCGRLILEPQRTNVLLNSENLTAANWDKYGGQVITANNAVSPDGYTSADKMTATGGVYEVKPFTASTAFTISAFIKKDTATSFGLEFVDQSGPFAGGGITYTFSTGAIAVVQSANSSVSGEAVNYGNGWIRLILTMTANAATNFNYQQFNFIGGTGWAWGFQMETGAYATSYIPTLGASVTRVADAASKTGISSLIGQTEGTLFVEVNDAANTGTVDRVVAIGDGTGANRILVLKNASGLIYFYVESGGSMRINATSVAGTSLVNGNYKIAVAYKSGDYAIYFNGVSVFTSTEAAVPATSNYYLAVNEEGGVSAFSGKFSQTLLFKTRLTNAQLAELTA
jgi:hypothetical protein